MEPTPTHVNLVERAPGTPRQLPPLLFLHGAWHGAWCWTKFLDFFSNEGYRCFTLELEGHGDTPRPANFDRRRVSSHLGMLREALGKVSETGAPYLIAHSMGGWLAQMLLAGPDAPSLRGTVLMAPVPAAGIPIRTSLKLMVQHPLSFARPLLFQSMPVSGSPMARQFFHRPDKPESEIERSVARLRPEGAMACIDLILGLSRVNPRKLRRVPTLLVAAGHDYFFPLASERRLARALGAEIAEFPGMAHNLMEDVHQLRVAETIRDWLRRTNVVDGQSASQEAGPSDPSRVERISSD